MKRRHWLVGIASLALIGCVTHPKQLAKGDVDRLADLVRKETRQGLLRLADKLYRRNPREWKKSGYASREAALEKLALGAWPRAGNLRGTERVLVALSERYSGDRVAGFIGGLMEMLDDAFDRKEEFFLTDDLDAQRLYNAARNLEIAAWKLREAKRSVQEDDLPPGSPLLFANEMGEVVNLSFEREFGKLIMSMDLLSQTVADRQNRTVAKVAQGLATAVFLPVK
ncbi:MAG: hypothetical protein N2441_08795 [Rhodocyclaceae bacterium]|nr:hypothetical protein [Rhodocyclaceae bacterium]